MEREHVSGFATIIGRPNVGKSTLLNEIIGEKISIISDKIQTTRHPIQGILSDDDSQIIFIDTPGIHKPKHRLGDYMVDTSLQSIEDVDVVLFMVNVKEGFGGGEQFILDKLKAINKPVILLLNKVDTIEPDAVFDAIVQYKDLYDFAEIIPISALNGNNVDTLIDVMKTYLPEGPKFYDEETFTDKSEGFLITELVREKVLLHTEEEVPHSVNVIIEHMVENDDGKMHVQGLIIVERESQKGILIGKRGSMLKRIGREARKDIEQLIDQKVYLELWVKVEKDWRNRKAILSRYGYEAE